MGGIFGKKVRCSHILVEDKAQAEKLLEELKAGADFAAKAKEHSKCPSGRNGGDLGRFGKGAMVPEFDKVAFELEEGEMSGLVKTKFGYHILKRTA
ncbi:MAG: peptidylprolyl isomerase [Candidatus Eremiobacteraeota bacterium]|nr:peptidylprolyl isomerase [Candidatus Eremiobacteraeota bacterium]